MTQPEPAISTDAPRLLALREQAAQWLTGRGIAQWAPGEIGPGEIFAQVGAGEWFVLRRAGVVVGGLRLLSCDEPVWGPQPDKALYVHGLVVDRLMAGHGIGAALLGWAALRARATGQAYLRLDCVESNSALRAYYARSGFTEVGRRDFTGRPWHPVVLLQKRLTGDG